MRWALVDKNGTVQNIIMYDGVSPYTTFEHLTLEQINDWIKIGDNKNVERPK